MDVDASGVKRNVEEMKKGEDDLMGEDTDTYKATQKERMTQSQEGIQVVM